MKTTSEVLLVDDNPADVDLIRDVLVRSNHPPSIRVLNDGAEAIAFLKREGPYASAAAPDFVILDLSLPKRDGRAVLASVKADSTLRKIPIVVFSTSEARQDIIACYESGANCYVSKPGNLRDFRAAVTSMQEFWFGSARLPSEEEA